MHLERYYARFHAELRRRLCCYKSSSMVRSEVRLGWLRGRCQSAGRRLMATMRARKWSCDGRREQCDRTKVTISSWWKVWLLTGPASDFVVCDVRCIWNAQDMTNAPLVKSIISIQISAISRCLIAITSSRLTVREKCTFPFPPFFLFCFLLILVVVVVVVVNFQCIYYCVITLFGVATSYSE